MLAATALLTGSLGAGSGRAACTTHPSQHFNHSSSTTEFHSPLTRLSAVVLVNENSSGDFAVSGQGRMASN